MHPRDLKPEQFASYPSEARQLAGRYLDTLSRLPLSFLPNLLRELIEYDFKFPTERKALSNELERLTALSKEEAKQWLHAFDEIRLSPQLESFDWVNAPGQFVEQLSAHLWTTHQLDAFRAAATDYASRLHAAIPVVPPPIPRLGIAIVGQGVENYSEPLFRKLRPHGVYFTNVNPKNGLQLLLEAAADRAKSHPVPYGHWYIDGGKAAEYAPALTFVGYGALEPVRGALLRKIRSEVERPGMGPELLRTIMAQWRPRDMGFDERGDVVVDHFQLKLLTEGSGTQIFSTSFAQWAAREALRRAEPLTLLVRFAPRQRQRPMNELLGPADRDRIELDPVGSLVDADMAAYYQWINQRRLPGAEQSSFIAWFENHSVAVAIGPALPRGTESNSALDLRQLLSWMA